MLPCSRLLPGAALTLCLLLPAAAPAAPVSVGTTLLVSAADGSSQPLPTPVGSSTLSGTRSVSADGRRVVFVSNADGLAPDDDDAVSNVYVKDRGTGAVILVSRATGVAGLAATSGSSGATISADGTKVAFSTTAALDPADANGVSDVYVRDLVASTTRLVSHTAGGGAGNAGSDAPVISGDGSVVAFDSQADDFVTSTGGVPQVFVAPTDGSAVPALVSRSTANAVANQDAGVLDVDGSGQRILFTSRADNLAAGDNTATFDVFLRNRQTGTTTVMSAANGSSAPGTGRADTGSISADGHYVAFASTAPNLTAGDGDATSDIFRRTVGTSTTVLVSPGPASGPKGASDWPTISDDGAEVAYRSASGIDPADTAAGSSDVYVTTVGAGTELATRADGSAGAPLGTSVAIRPALSRDGTFVVFGTYRGAITPDDDPLLGSPYGRTLTGARHTELIGRPPGGEPFRNAGGQAFVPGAHAQSADGRYALVLFEASVLGAGALQQLWRRDLETGAMVLVSRADGADGAPADAASYDGALSADGRWAAFTTSATNLDAADGSPDRSAYLRDLRDGRTYLVSRADGAAGAAAGIAGEMEYASTVDVSDDGSKVLFVSDEALAADGASVPSGTDQLYLRDRAAGRTELVSRATGAAGAAGDGASYEASLSGDGGRVAFMSGAKDLGDGDTTAVAQVHLRDLAAATTTLISATGDGVPADRWSDLPSISADGRRVAFRSSADNLDPAGTGTHPAVFVRDVGGGVALASRVGAAGPELTADAGAPVLSRDGGHVAFLSTAPELAGGRAPQAAAYERRLADGRTTPLLELDPGPGTPSDARIDALAVDADGGCALLGVVSGPTSLGIGSPDFEQVLARAASAPCGAADAAGPSGGGGVSTPPPAHGRDTVAPRISRLRVARAGHRLVVRFALSERATARLSVERLRGRRPRVVLRRRAGRLATGAHRVALSIRRLPHGHYRLSITATDAAGNRSRARHRTLILRSHG